MLKKIHIHTKQQDSADCGTACVMSLLNFYDNYLNYQYLRDILKTDTTGTRSSSMIHSLQNLGFEAKLVRLKQLNVVSMQKIVYPCIAHTFVAGLEHYIVLYGLKKNRLIVSDPQKEKICLVSFDEFISSFTGVIILAYPSLSTSLISPMQKKKNSAGQKIWRICKHNLPYILLSAFFALVAAISAVVFSYIYRAAFDFVVPEKNEDLLNQIIGAFLLIILVKGLFEFLRGMFISMLSRRIDDRLANHFFTKILKLPLNFFTSRENGDTLARFHDISSVRNLISNTLILSAIDLMTICITSFILYKENQQLFFISLSPVLIYLCINSLFFNQLHKSSKKSIEDQSYLTSHMIQVLEGMESIHALNKQPYVHQNLINKLKGVLKRNFLFNLLSNINISLTRTIQSFFSLVVLWVGIKQIINDQSSIGQLMTFTALASYFILSVERLVNAQPDIIKAYVAINRYYEYLDYPTPENSVSGILCRIDSIIFDKLSYSYTNSKVLENLSLVISRNESIAIVGQSGSGKTTLAKLIVRILDSNEGKLMINHTDINNLDIYSVRQKIIYLSQNPFFFTGSLRENLCMGTDFTEKELKIACEAACIWEEIQRMPGQLGYAVLESGSNFSLGQKQRLSLARALLNKPEVVICDEIMSNVDVEKCRIIYNNLQNIQLTRLYITHKPEDIPYVDKIFDLDKNMLIKIREEVSV
ncbi:peptidase domain-containing ABC transporter [Paenibacillus sp. FSL R10-2771]|uniref:peptidase domain-containing ABC transporter n=1 Tax=Paenibacillus sp. FSL R10-2771 TaxID=2954693 RepID=UPI0030FB7051